MNKSQMLITWWNNYDLKTSQVYLISTQHSNTQILCASAIFDIIFPNDDKCGFRQNKKIMYPKITLYKKIFQLHAYSVGKSSNKYLLSTHIVPDTVPGTWNIIVNKTSQMIWEKWSRVIILGLPGSGRCLEIELGVVVVDLIEKVLTEQNLNIWKELRELSMQMYHEKHSRQRE